jgi:hypothetical protein
MVNANTLRLDSCRVLSPLTHAEARRLTADYLPHTPGRALVYDVAVFPLIGGKQIARQVWEERNEGSTSVVITHLGQFPGKSLLGENETGKWINRRTTKTGRIPSLGHQYRLAAAHVQIGQRPQSGKPGAQMTWEPVLKIGARPGETWKWMNDNEEHTYTLVRFDSYRGRSAAIVQDVIITNLDEQHPREIRRMYAQGIGEVERQETLTITAKEKKVIAERKLVQFEDPPFKQ